MAKLTILRGVSGSGKSTWAAQQNAVVVSRDALRDIYAPVHKDFPEAYYALHKDVLGAHEHTITVMQDALIAGLLKAGKDVIVDNTNIQWKFVKALAKIGYRYGAEVEVKVFDVPLQRAVNNNTFRAARGGRDVNREVIEKQYAAFQKNKSMTLDPVQPVIPYEGTPGKPKAFLVDIDGTLAHMRDYRGPFDWAKVGLDDVDDKIAYIVKTMAMDPHIRIIVMSGRDEVCREQTEEWLELHGIMYDDLFMRPEKDMRPDNLVKAELFDTYVRDNFDVQFVLDDRPQVCDMWRRMGITVLQVGDPYNDF